MKKFEAVIHLVEDDEGKAWQILHKLLKDGKVLESMELRIIGKCLNADCSQWDLEDAPHNID